MIVATITQADGGIACRVVSVSLTVCRALPREPTWPDVLFWGVLLAGGLTLWGQLNLIIQHQLERRPRRGYSNREDVYEDPCPSEVVPVIHFPQRAPYASEDVYPEGGLDGA